jgi:tripartite-type tricarboxylate transporter receptor subunit TctC
MTANERPAIMITRRDMLGGSAALLLAGIAPAGAQDFPAKPVTIVVPFAPGGSTDVATRAVAERMTASMGQTVLVENRAGASGMIGTDHVARAKPDGYTTGAIGLSTGVLSHLMGPVPNFAPDDLTMVGQICFAEFVIIAKKELEASNVEELVALAKANPGKLRCGSSGTATLLGIELFKSMAGADIVVVPYNGDSPAINDVVGGHVDMALLSLSGSSAQIRAGTVKAIGVTSSERSKGFPDVPTIAEGGLEGYESGGPTMLAVPKSTPAPVIESLNTALNKALSDPALVDQFTGLGLGVKSFTPQEADAVMASEMEKWAKVIKTAGIDTGR